MTELIRYDAACRALAEAKSIDEVKDIRDFAEAARSYARVAKNREMEVDAAEIRIRAERRLGDLIAAQKATVGLATGTRGQLKGRKSGGSVVEPPEDSRPTLAEAGIDKKLSSRAQQLAEIPAEEFEGEIKEWRGKVSQQTERVTTHLARKAKRATVKRTRPDKPLPVGEYRLLYADPPWRYEHVKTQSRAIENQYPTMGLDEIKALKVPKAQNAVLFLWATSPKLAEALDVVASWGFTYRTCAVWDKGQIGMGYYFRQQHELLLVATCGDKPPVPTANCRVSSVIRAKRGPHSAKPTKVYEVLEGMYPKFRARDRIELFARTARAGWSAWGNEPEA